MAQRLNIDIRRPWLGEHALSDPRRPALISGDRSVDFATLADGAARVARDLSAQGLRAGDRVAVLARSSQRFVEVVHAAMQARIVLAPMNTSLTIDELSAQLRLLEPCMVLFDADHEAVTRAAAPSGTVAREIDHDLSCTAREASVETASLELDALSTVLFTSGTSASPKAVMLSAAAHAASAAAVNEHLRMGPDDRWLAALPLHHVGGLSILYRSVLAGFAVVLEPRFDARSTAQVLGLLACKPTGDPSRGPGRIVASLVPTMLSRILDAADQDAARRGDGAGPSPPLGHSVVILGGGPCTRDLCSRARSRGLMVVTTYGMTETASQVTATELDDASAADALDDPAPDAAAPAGTALGSVRISIADPDATGLGEIVVRGPQVMLGYLGNEAASKRALSADGLHTGDIGRLDDEGTLHVATRRCDLILTGGENVVPEEVEQVLRAHPEIDDAAVYGRDDPEWGQRVVAAIVVRGATREQPRDVETFARAHLAAYKIPREIHVVDEIPRSASGKLLRRALVPRGGLK